MKRIGLPEHGTEWPELSRRMSEMAQGDTDWRAGKVPLFVFKATDSVQEVGQAAFNQFFAENALGAKRAFQSLKRMEDDVVAMALDLFRAPDQAVGHMTSGGSESIFLAVKAAREHHRARHGRGRTLNMVLPESAHPAFEKAAITMDIDVRRRPLRQDRRADPATIADAVDQDTMLIVGSAPCFPFGVVDPITALSELALAEDLWLHVDACVGGYVLPFARANGVELPVCDMFLAGVRSLSADLHKFGFCPKPASTVFFRDPEDMARNAFDLDVWANGRFVTQTLVGTRPGGGVAGAWAVMNHLGHAGYRAIAADLITNAQAYAVGIRAIPGLKLHAEPDLTILNFGSDDVDMFQVAERMAERGWLPGLTQQPRGMHLMLSMLHAPARPAWLSDLADAVEGARESGDANGAPGSLKASY
ncbi:MAG: pyridoxal-dependent decarboxylase [Minwuia sp.]|nr:pyridoxal-dependent decarboxylase [Minwuia sp.]